MYFTNWTQNEALYQRSTKRNTARKLQKCFLTPSLDSCLNFGMFFISMTQLPFSLVMLAFCLYPFHVIFAGIKWIHEWSDAWILRKTLQRGRLQPLDTSFQVSCKDVRAIWLWHLSPHWSPGLIRLIWLARRVSPSSLTAPCVFLPQLHTRSKRTTIPDRGGPVFSQGYMSSCAPLLELPNKLSSVL